MVSGRSLDISDTQESVLDLCLRNGISIPWDCNKGTCGSCRINATLEGSSASILACQEKPADGMHLVVTEQVCAGLDAPRQVADNIIRYLEYRMRAPKMADDEARMDVLIQQYGFPLENKLAGKKLKQLLRGSHIHLDKAYVNDIEALIMTRIARHRNPDLRLLDLNGNPSIGDVGATFIAEGLVASDHELRSLFLSNCGITDVGGSALAKALRQNDDLMILELRRNALTDSAAAELAESLVNHPELAHLYLTGNAIGNSGALALASAVAELADRPKSSSRKVKVWLGENEAISDDMRQRIERIVPKHTIRF